ncbi:SPFH domain-containing protein [Bifidobacterium dentium]|uniref:SPFH domain-containing protein n=1 Tax=Bifidobacterium dentium TaxID=1689 RepID=UPI0018C32666|nr:SPFH domain-containing protein [Bifidobacterium dentium]MBF9704120.1 SPFH domain-containing protein [Bifidobacterium dentium]MBF9706158.1 SPFH domain-containing protein [Bifidobacterium dentium]
MGLLKAGVGAAGGVLADQWREYFYCEALDADTLVAKGEKRVGKRGSNTKGENNVISDGSIVAVADGQCMMIVENGAVVDVCAEPGEFVYDTGTEPSVFSGKLGDMVKKSFEQVGRRFTFGGDAGKDQRIYYFNTKEIVGNKYGTASPVPFRVVDEKIGLDVDITVRCNGEYSYKLVDPLMFYKNVCGNVESAYTRDLIDSQLKSELLTALQPAFARISEMGIRYSAVPAHTRELADALNEELSHEWKERRGIEIAAFGVNTISAPEDQEQMIRDLQKAAVMANPAMAAANIASAQSDAMRTAAANPAGAAMGFMGMGMASGMGGMNAAQLFGQASQAQQAPAQASQAQQAPAQTQPAGAAGGVAAGTGMAAGAAWTCSCGAQNTGKFCGNCGSPKPEAAGPWFCTNCGTQNTGNFCSGCGSKRP